MTLDEELSTGQTPNPDQTRFPECRCDDVGKGGCHCYRDDGTVAVRVFVEASEHEPGGFPRRVLAPSCAVVPDRVSFCP